MGLDQEVTAAELFPSPPSALEANGRVVEPPKDQADLEGWLRKVRQGDSDTNLLGERRYGSAHEWALAGPDYPTALRGTTNHILLFPKR